MGSLKRRLTWGLALLAVGAALIGVGVVAANGFTVSPLFDFSKTGTTEHAGPTDGMLSPFLVGYYDGREGSDSLAEDGCDEFGNLCVDDLADDVDDVEPVLYLVNPTPATLVAYIVAFDNEGNPIACDVRTLTPGDVTDVLIAQIFGGAANDELGVVEVVTFANGQAGSKVQAGAQGWLTHYVEETNSVDWAYTRESEMAELPLRVLMADVNPRDGVPDQLQTIVDYVNSTNNCSSGT